MPTSTPGAITRRIGSVMPQRCREDTVRQEHAAEGNHGEDRDRRDENRHRGDEVQALVDVAGRELGLEEELHAVGQRLAQAEQADLRQRDAHPVRPQPVLHPGGDPALDQHQVGRRRHQPADHQGDLDQGFKDDGEHGAMDRIDDGQESEERFNEFTKSCKLRIVAMSSHLHVLNVRISQFHLTPSCAVSLLRQHVDLQIQARLRHGAGGGGRNRGSRG